MKDRDKLRENLKTLAALLADIADQIESESSGGRIRELHQQCLLELALIEKAENDDAE